MLGLSRRFVVVALCALTISTGSALAQAGPTGDFAGLVDVGGYRLFLRCTGQGSPTVILDASLGATSETWNPIQPAVARSTRVCSYDRAGMGSSDPGPVPRTSRTMVEELRILLRNAGVPGPYVLVGHSLGGLNMQLYARLYPGEVVGVVLVDATPADLYDRWAEVLTPEQLEQLTPTPDRNPEGIDIRASLAQVQNAPPFPNVPLVVLVQTVFCPCPPGLPHDELARIWNELQRDQARLSPRGALIFVQGASHFIHFDRPDVVIAAILRVVNAARGVPTHTPADFDGNGTTDIAVFRPSSGTWLVRNGATVAWGTSGDIPVAGDYDGNGTTDLAVFRPSSGTWFVHGGAVAQWGTSGDLPVPGDYDGNGTTDMAVYRPSSGTWFVRNGATVAWGTSGDVPVPGDYDGNGSTDMAVYRPSSGIWLVRNGVTAAWGTSGDVPAPGDYDANGTTDMAVFRPSSGIWFVRNGPTAAWGTSGDIPVPGDYDGNGTTDIAVYRPSGGIWFVNGGPASPFGTSGDIPVPLAPAIRLLLFATS